MTLLDDAPAAEPTDVTTDATPGPTPPGPGGEAAASGDPRRDGDRPVGVGLTCAAVAVAGAAVGWMLGAVFVGALPRVLAVTAAAAGAGVVLLSQRTNRPAVWQYLALPLAVALGALVVLPSTTGGSANLPSLVKEAVQSGGLAEPPVPFDPGWRFLLVVLVMTLCAGAAALGTSLERPRLAVGVLVPVVVAAALVQPPGSAAITSAVALLGLVGALILASGAQLVQEGSSSARFEGRRLLRGAGALALLAAVVVPLSQAGLLFPGSKGDHVIPPQRPQAQPPLSDRTLFTVQTSESGDLGPWTFGVLDVYDGAAWRLPPYDTKRFGAVRGPGDLAVAARSVRARPQDGPDGIPAGTDSGRRVTFTVGDLPGRVLPTIDGARQVVDRSLALQLDPRTQTLRSTNGRADMGSHYTVVAATTPDAAVLSKVTSVDPRALAADLAVPPPPTAVANLLAAAPRDNLFRRLQFVRNTLYAHVVAYGQGTPVEVPPERVAAMLAGAKASPYEIVAAEALLARWAGVPARIGYGFYAGTPDRTGRAFQVHPHDGATWLQAYFPGSGWVSIIGKPPHAEASTALQHKRQEDILPTGLAVIVHVPVELSDLHQLYESVRYWALVALPGVLAVVLALVFYPALLKALRRGRRRRWAARRGLDARILVAYCDLRDRLADINAPMPSATPLEFCRSVAWDEEHWELAWLVTRALYGDLRRDLRREDAEAAEEMSRSVAVRVLRAQKLGIRTLGQANRSSLRRPWTTDVPNAWPTGQRWRRVRSRARRSVRALDPRRLRRSLRLPLPQRASSLVLLLFALCGLTACGTTPAAPPPLPTRLVPAAVGDYAIQREPRAEQAFAQAGPASLVTAGHVYTVHRAGEVLGSLQLAQFLPKVGSDRTKVERALRSSLGNGDFRLQRVNGIRVYEMRQDEGRVLLYFPPGGGYYVLLEARNGFDDAERVFAGVIGYETGTATATAGTTLPDQRRGGD